MDFQTALKTLELSPNFSLNDMKRNYYKLCLKWHPDKNNSPDSTKNFQMISEAYEFLKIYLDVKNEKDPNDKHNETENVSFFELFNNFLINLTGATINNQYLINIVTQLSEGRDKISVKLFEGLNKETSILLFDYLTIYSDVLHISEKTLDEIKTVISDKYKNDNIIVLHPSIDNLLNDDLYKLDFSNDIYHIPLWHDELVYDLSCGELIVKIIPEIPEHITIDNINNININLTTKIKGLLTNGKISFSLGEKVFEIPCDELRIKKTQNYVFKNIGISKINLGEIFNVCERSNIIVKLTLIDIE
jgi:hypothetical protein